MDTINNIINNKLKCHPDGFDVEDVAKWLKDIPKVYSFSIFEPTNNQIEKISFLNYLNSKHSL